VLLAAEENRETALEMFGQLDESDFDSPQNRTVFRFMSSCEADGAPLDCVTVGARMATDPETQSLGLVGYLAGLTAATPSSAGFEYWLPVLKEKTARRQLLRKAESMRAQALDESCPVSTSAAGIVSELEKRLVNFDCPPPEARAVFTLDGKVIATPGNLATIGAGVKTGKSAAVSAQVASTFGTDGDFLGFASSNPDKKHVLWFDSEQAPRDFFECCLRAAHRAGLDRLPAWVRAYSLAGLHPEKAVALVKAAAAACKVRGIHSVFLDGVADFVNDVNDAAECNQFVADLMASAIAWDCPIIGVIHFNPGSEKTRGHLGSQLERKAETNLRLEKSGDVTRIWSEKQRRAPIPRNGGPCFAWDDSRRMHCSTDTLDATQAAEKKERAALLAEEIFADAIGGLRYSAITSAIKKALKVSAPTAERKLAEMVKSGAIKKSVAGIYVRGI
jgi:hypothetical protein